MVKKKIAVVFGTRPEAIKMAPVILELKKKSDYFETIVIVTSQHREMLNQVLKVFNIKPDYDLNIMKKNQTLNDITVKVLKGLETIYKNEKPDMVLVHGDTTTSFTAALAAYYQQISIGHVEAGLRTFDKYFPFPEEGNRQLIDSIADLFFVPTEATKNNLIDENKKNKNIFVTGNTVIDAIKHTKKSESTHDILTLVDDKSDQKWILLTMHRRESYGFPMAEVCKAVIEIVGQREDIEVLMPVHMSPVIQTLVSEELENHERIHLVKPLEVDVFHRVIDKMFLVLTDSGGLQEEAPALDVPVLVLRDKTERPEGLEAGTLKLVGTDRKTVIESVIELIENNEKYTIMSKANNPYGDGFASKRIVSIIAQYFFNELLSE